MVVWCPTSVLPQPICFLLKGFFLFPYDMHVIELLETLCVLHILYSSRELNRTTILFSVTTSNIYFREDTD